MRRPKLRTPMLLTIATALTWALEGLMPTRTMQLVAQAVTMILAIGALWSGLHLLAYTLIDLRKLWSDNTNSGSLALSESETRRAALILQMSEEQLNAYGRTRVEIEMVPAPGGPIKTLIFPYAVVPADFVNTFMAHSTETYLAPVRRWAEGSKNHGYADALTKYFVDDGFAGFSAGNHSAYWLSEKKRQDALISIEYWEDGEG